MMHFFYFKKIILDSLSTIIKIKKLYIVHTIRYIIQCINIQVIADLILKTIMSDILIVDKRNYYN